MQPIKYKGYINDEETGYYYLQSRYYSPFLKRFISLDDTGILEATKGEILGANLYAYCNNNPTMNEDPTGYFSLPTWLVASAIDILIWAMSPYVGATASSLGWTIKGFSRIPSMTNVARKLIFGKVIPFAKGALRTVGWIIRKAVWRLTGVTVKFLSDYAMGKAFGRFERILKNKTLKKITYVVSVFSSFGSMIATFLDYISDNSENGRIKLW